jgi:anti-sigma regulatory factor (Ser/Thr protein kinase)
MNAHGQVVRKRRWSATAKRVRDARHFVGETVAAETIGACDDDVRLVTSELVTNAVLHARTPFTVIVTCTGKLVLIEVTDGSKAFRPASSSGWRRATVRRQHPSDQRGGLGLTLVQTVALRWGWEATREGKTVWAILRAPGGTRAAASAKVSDGSMIGD